LRQELPQQIFALRICWGAGGLSHYATTPLIVALSLRHSDITRFCPWSPIATGIHLDRTGQIKFQTLLRWHRWCFRSAFRHFGTHFGERFRMSKSSWMMDPTHPCEMSSCLAIELAKIWRSSKIGSWIWLIISGVVTVLGCPGPGAIQVEKSPHLNWAIQFLMVAYKWCMFP
jgi:hypothetical protein